MPPKAPAFTTDSVYSDAVKPLQKLSLWKKGIFQLPEHILGVLEKIPDEGIRTKYIDLFHKYENILVQEMLDGADLSLDLYEQIIQACHALARKLAPKEQFPLRPLHVFELTPECWEHIHDAIGIESPHDGTAYRGGVARLIARMKLGLPHPPGDTKAKDVDMYIDKSKHPSKKQFSFPQSGTEGYFFIDDFSENAIVNALHAIDADFNEVCVTKDKIYFTDNAKRSWETQTIANATGRNISLFSQRNYEKEGVEIPSANTLYRLFKMLVERKAHTVIVPEHSLTVENLFHLKFKKYILTIVKKLHSLPHDEQCIAFYRLGVLLDRLQITNGSHSIFRFVDHLRDVYPERDIADHEPMDMRKEANWILRKYIRFVHFLEDGPIADIAKYNVEHTKEVSLSLPYDTLPDSNFIHLHTQWLRKHGWLNTESNDEKADK